MPPLVQVLKLNATRKESLTSSSSAANHAAARATISSFPDSKLGTYEFIECDATLMKNLNFLVLSPRLLQYRRGRDETAEGLDKKAALLYYARWKFIYDLMPLLQNAAASAEDAKVYSVLGAGTGSAIDLDDLGLKKRYSALKAATAAATYTDLMMEKFATTNPQVQFTHAFPGLVRTPMMRPKHWALKPLAPLISVAAYPFTVTPELIPAREYQLSALFDNTKTGFVRRGAHGDDIGYTPADPGAVSRLWEHTLEATGSR
ncbi:NAD(P)-binding protein [Mycena olivaceomarginata]|nr:NAD(P)-binding protein [Mycena olivaceomarginata]